mmetsp:Transcript_38858/g.102438  ORF Transcript_38858/g.102438 Transcript_38858/m.102438 type:complete len:259 (+) Transcript_38858:230-1006(+)
MLHCDHAPSTHVTSHMHKHSASRCEHLCASGVANELEVEVDGAAVAFEGAAQLLDRRVRVRRPARIRICPQVVARLTCELADGAQRQVVRVQRVLYIDVEVLRDAVVVPAEVHGRLAPRVLDADPGELRVALHAHQQYVPARPHLFHKRCGLVGKVPAVGQHMMHAERHVAPVVLLQPVHHPFLPQAALPQHLFLTLWFVHVPLLSDLTGGAIDFVVLGRVRLVPRRWIVRGKVEALRIPGLQFAIYRLAVDYLDCGG